MQQSMIISLLKILGTVAVVYLAIVLLYFIFQRHVIYYPHKTDESTALSQAESRGLSPWRNEVNELIGWKHDSESESKRLLVFHGNAGNALMRDYFVQLFRTMNPDWSIYLFEYPGYGARAGSPGEGEFVAAAIDAFDSLNHGNSTTYTYLLGESLGSAVAAQLASSRPDSISGLLLITPFNRMSDVGRYHFPWLPIRPLLRDQYDSVQALENYEGPVVIVTAEQDQVVPPQFGRKLYDAYSGPKYYHQLENSGHNNINYRPDNPVWERMILRLEEPKG